MMGRKEPMQAEKSFLFRSLILGSIFIAACLYVSGNIEEDPWKRRKLAGQHHQLADHISRRLMSQNSYPITIRYKPDTPRQRGVWTQDYFPVNGVNLAQFGFEAQENPEIALYEYFELYEDFDLTSYLKAGEDFHSVHHLLMFHRHLESRSLAFYLDIIAQKRYLNAIGTPIKESHHINYQHQFNKHDSDEAAIKHLLPKEADYVVRPTHKRGKPVYVAYDEETNVQLMGPDPANINEVFDPDSIANHLARDMVKTKVHFLDAWATFHVPAGIVVEDRFTAFDSQSRAPTEISVYVIWGRVFVGVWHNAEGPKHNGIVFRNSTVLMDDGTQMKTPRWIQWEGIVDIAEELAAHKDFYQVNFEIGMNAAMSKIMATSSRSEQMKEIQVVVSDVMFNPSLKSVSNELLEEMGRLWLAGYQMGICKTIHNDEVNHYVT